MGPVLGGRGRGRGGGVGVAGEGLEEGFALEAVLLEVLL